MEQDIKKMGSQVSELCKAMNQITQFAVVISDRLTVQDKKMDVILNKLLQFTSPQFTAHQSVIPPTTEEDDKTTVRVLKDDGTKSPSPTPQTQVDSAIKVPQTAEKTQNAAKFSENKSKSDQPKSPRPRKKQIQETVVKSSHKATSKEEQGVCPAKLETSKTIDSSTAEVTSEAVKQVMTSALSSPSLSIITSDNMSNNSEGVKSISGSKSSPAMTNEKPKNKKVKKYLKKKDKNDENNDAVTSSTRKPSTISNKIPDEMIKMSKSNSDKSNRHTIHVKKDNNSKVENTKPTLYKSKKVSCESGVFSSDDLFSDDVSDDVIYEIVVSEEEIVLEETSNSVSEGDSQSVSPSSTDGSAGDVKSLSPVVPDETQVQNSNHAPQDISLCDVTNNARPVPELQTPTSEKETCDVTSNCEGNRHEAGADHDKKSTVTELLTTPTQNGALASGRRASYAGLTVKQKQAIVTDKSKDVMTPASLKQDDMQRPHSSCELRYNTAKSDAGDTCVDRRLFDVKRQFSNSSTSSAPSGIQITLGADSDSEDDEIEIKIPELPQPVFSHRSVTVKNSTYKHFYDLKEAIGGGRFGRVHRCIEKKTGLQLAAKCFQCKKPVPKSLLKAKSLRRPKNVKRTAQEPVDKSDVMTEIQIMNQIDHRNIVKLYDAYENDNTMTLILEYLGGGELFERVLADQSQLTELDAVLFMKQIVSAVQYLHKNLILHLDLKPENILCLDRSTHHIKIIDFGLARKYNPRQKLVVQWGTPEFMAPELLNYDVVSFPSDMWSIGVICYILLSGMSPFLGDDDSDTMENILDCAWDFEEPPFKSVSPDAKDFISRLLVEEKSGRMSAAQCLRHEWLAAPLTSKRRKALINKTHLKKFMARIHWKASVAVVTATNWLRNKVNSGSDDSSCDTAV